MGVIFSERYLANAALLRSRFRLSVCNARVLCINSAWYASCLVRLWMEQGNNSRNRFTPGDGGGVVIEKGYEKSRFSTNILLYLGNDTT